MAAGGYCQCSISHPILLIHSVLPMFPVTYSASMFHNRFQDSASLSITPCYSRSLPVLPVFTVVRSVPRGSGPAHFSQFPLPVCPVLPITANHSQCFQSLPALSHHHHPITPTASSRFIQMLRVARRPTILWTPNDGRWLWH